MPRRNMKLRPTPPGELDRLSEISMTDAEEARARWKVVAPQPFRALADVTEVVDASPDALP